MTTILNVISNPSLEAWRLRVGAQAALEKQQTSARRGTDIHSLVEDIIHGVPIPPDHPYKEEGLSFVKWFNKYQPTDVQAEIFVYSEDHGYAGKVDIKCRLNGELYIIDTKTSRIISPTFGLQLRGYEHANREITGEPARTAVLQITQPGTIKEGYRFVEVNEPLSAFLACKSLFDWKQKFSKETFDGTFLRTA